jgi:acetyl-CoA carboxylase biotin carboxyl carrier protein
MDVGLLAELVKLMAANDLNTVEVRDGDKRVVLKRGPAAPSFTYGAPMPAPPTAPPVSQPQAAASGGAGQGAAPAPDESAGLVAIKAEMVGTFYSSPKPGEPAFVNVGSTVDDETTVCVIEAMKNFFPVKAGVRGSIAKVLVQNGQTVQFDQALFLVRPA